MQRGLNHGFVSTSQMGKAEAMGPKANFSWGQPVDPDENHRLLEATHIL